MRRTRLIVCLLVALVALPLSVNASAVAERKGASSRLHPNMLPLIKSSEGLIPVIVRFASTPTAADKRMLVEAGFKGPFVRYAIVPAVQTAGPAKAIERILSAPRVRYIEHDAVIPWAMDRAVQATRAKDVWTASYERDGANLNGITGKGIGIAVVDSGVDATHPDLLHHSIANRLNVPAKTVANLKMIGRDSVGLYDTPPEELGVGEFLEANVLGVDMADTDTTGGHGTHVAGITSGNGEASKNRAGGRPPFKGAAPGANLIGFGAGETLVVSSSLAAFDWILKNHANFNIRVVNNSWGGAGEWNPESVITQGAQALVKKGITMVFAAGNAGGNGTTLQTSLWANIPEVISVGNYYDRTGWLDNSSSRGLRNREDTWPDVSAPGTQIISTAAKGKPVTVYGTTQDMLIDEALGQDAEPTVVPVPLPQALDTTIPAPFGPIFEAEEVVVGDYASFTGTSMSAPHVAGVVALILEANPSLTPAQVKEILRDTANMPAGRNYKFDGYAVGKGVVDAAEAVAVALKMYDGLPHWDALRLARVDYGSTTGLNPAPQQNVQITKPRDGDQLAGSTVTVSGTLTKGFLTDQSLPLAPNRANEPQDPFATPPPPLRPSGEQVFFTDFEGNNSGWQIRQNGTGPGLLTDWSEIDHSLGGVSWAGTHSGSKMFYAGLWPAADLNSGLTYTDFANTSLISPTIDLTGSTSASLSYWRAGMSEANRDFLRVLVAPADSENWRQVDSITGDFVFSGRTGSWEESIVDLDTFVGQRVRVRFQFTSAFQSPFATNLVGWYIDDVSVRGEPGTPPPVVIKPSISANPDFGVVPLTTNISYSVAASAPISEVRLDFGDGSPIHTTTQTVGTVPHTYTRAGLFSPTVTAFSGARSAIASTFVDVAPVNAVQVRIDSKPWKTVVTTTASTGWSTSLDLTGVAAGPQRIFARYCQTAGCVWDYVDVIKIEPPVRIDPVTVNEGAGSVNVTARLREASGSPVTATFTTVDGTAKAGQDYTAVTGTLNFLPGQTTKTIAVPITNDTLYEGNETFKVFATDHLGRTSEGVVTIVSNDGTPRMSISDKVVSEGEAGFTPAHLTVSLSNPSAFPFKVNYATRNGTAVAGTDYQAATGTVTFNPGETSKIITVNVVGDVIDENNETFFVDLSAPNGGVIADGTGQVTIFDEDGSTTPLSTSSNTSWWNSFVKAISSPSLGA